MKVNRLLMAIVAVLMTTAMVSCDSTKAEQTDEPQPIEKEDEPQTIEPLSEEIRPTYTDGKRWIYDTVSEEYPDGGEQRLEYKVDGDVVADETVFDYYVKLSTDVYGKTVKQVSYMIPGDDEPMIEYMIEDKGHVSRIWQVSEDNSPRYKFLPMWDIEPTQGDVYQCRYYYAKIVSRGTITLMGKVRRAVKVWSDSDVRSLMPYDYWVEGIGPLFGQQAYYGPYQGRTPAPYYTRLRECYDGNDKIYDYREFKPELYKPIEEF